MTVRRGRRAWSDERLNSHETGFRDRPASSAEHALVSRNVRATVEVCGPEGGEGTNLIKSIFGTAAGTWWGQVAAFRVHSWVAAS